MNAQVQATINQIAILDPNTEADDKISPIKSMKEVLTMLGPTPIRQCRVVLLNGA